MNSRILSFILISLFLFSCENTIKNNSKEVVVENGTEVTNDSSNLPIEQEMDFTIHFLPDIHSKTPFKSPVFRADYFSFVFIKGMQFY